MNPSPSTINLVTNVIAFLLAILEPLKAYFASQPFDWTTFALCIGGAIIAYFTGKSGMSAMKTLKKP
jgi:hypothetical protein